MEKKERTYYTEDLIEGTIDELQDRLKEEEINVLEEGWETHDIVSEVADNNIPIYTYDLLQYASNNFNLIEPNDLAGDNPDVIKIIQANMYDILHTELYGYITTIRDNKKETEKE